MSVLSDIAACVIIPTYNNEKTLSRVIDGVLAQCARPELIVVNDGSTDNTSSILASYSDRITVLSYPKNKGKGNALKVAFEKALALGFKNAITIDSDGQHYPDDIPVFVEAAKQNPGALLMGARNMQQEGVPTKSSFGNKFSNFWYKLETGIELPDTQTGFRLYPLEPLRKIKLRTSKFETEIEVIVKLAWQNVAVLPVNVKVLYDPNERVSHFRPFKDFTRISILNTYFVVLTFAYYLPKRLLKAATKKAFWLKLKNDIIQPNEKASVKALSIGFGLFMGIVPIWGFQLLIGIPLAILFRLNKALFIAAAHISIPPMIPVLVIASYYVGGQIDSNPATLPALSEVTLETIHVNFVQYALGAVLLALFAGLAGSVISYCFLSLYKKLKPKVSKL